MLRFVLLKVLAMLKLEPREVGLLRNEGYETYVVAGSGLASVATGLVSGLAATGSGLAGWPAVAE